MNEHRPEVEAHTDTPYCVECREDWPCQTEEHLDYQLDQSPAGASMAPQEGASK